MNRQIVLGIAGLAVVVIAVIAYIGFGGGEDGSSGSMPITGPERAEEARNVIADIEQARERAAAEAPQRNERPAETAASPVDTGAGAVTPEPVAAPAAGAVSELDEAYAKAEAFRKAGQLADAQLLYFYAARDGHPGAAFEYAAMNDPLHHSPETSLLKEPDAYQAYRWYTTALEGGNAAAQERLDALHEWAIAAAAKGDDAAERLLLQWEQ